MTSTVNPLLLGLEELNSAIYLNFSSPSAHTAYNNQLYILSALLGVCLLIQLTSLALRWRKGTLWIYRRSGGYIVIHGTVCWCGLSSIFLGLSQGFLFSMLAYGNPGASLNNIMLWRSLVFIPLLLGAWSMSWATYLAPILARQTHYSPAPSWYQRPLIINTFFLVVPLIGIAAMITFACLLSNTYNATFSDAVTLRGMLETALAGGEVDLIGMALLNARILGRDPELLKQWQDVYITWSIFVFIQLVLFTVSAVGHFRSLGNAMSQLKLRRTATPSVTSIPVLKNGSRKAIKTSFDEQMSALAWAYRGLLFTSSIVALLSAGYLVLDLTLTIKAGKIAEGKQFTQTIILIGLYLYATFGLISALAIFSRSFASNSSPSLPSHSSNNVSQSRFGTQSRFAVTIDRTVEVSTEGGRSDRVRGLNPTSPSEMEFELDFRRGEKDDLESYHNDGDPFAL